MARKVSYPLETTFAATTTMPTIPLGPKNNGLESADSASKFGSINGNALGQLQSSLTNLGEDMQHQNIILHGLHDQLHLKTEELDNMKNKAQMGEVSVEAIDVSEKVQLLRHDLMQKNLEIVRLQEALSKTETLQTAFSGSATSSVLASAPHEIPTDVPTQGDVVNIKEKRTVNFEVTPGNRESTVEDVGVYKREIEDLKLKLKSATQICVQQENHFSNLVKDLERRLCEAITSRDQLLTLRQHESGTQQKLIHQLQAALQQTKQTLELKSEELCDCQSRIKANQEKLTQAHTVLVKIQNILKSEESKRGGTNILTGITSDYEHPYAGDILFQILSNFLREDDMKINELVMNYQEMERQLMELKETSEAEKCKLIKDCESKVTRLKADHAKSLDIAANRTLTERNRIAELLREIDESRLKHEKQISEEKKNIVTLEEKNKTFSQELEDKTKVYEIQHAKDVALLEELQTRADSLQNEKEELLKNMMLKTASETTLIEKVAVLESQLKEAVEKLKITEKNYQLSEKAHLDNMSQLKQALNAKDNEIRRIFAEHKEELQRKTEEYVAFEKDESSRKYILLENMYTKSSEHASALEEDVRQKSDEVSKLMEDCTLLKEKVEYLEKEKIGLQNERDSLLLQHQRANEQISRLQEDKSNLSTMIRNNVHDLSRAKNMIDDLQVKLDEREKSLDVYNKQDADLVELLLKKHLVGESLLQERRQIVGILEEKIRESDELKEVRDALAHKLEAKILALNELESACRALETKLDVRSNELEVIMEDRNKVVNDLKTRDDELAKLKEERDSLVTLMSGKESEKEREVNKLISRLKDTQRDLALTKKVLEAKRESSGKAMKMAALTQEEITSKRKEIDTLKDRIKWLQESLQATTEEKASFENKTSELASELQSINIENETLKVEVAQFMKSYDDARGRVIQMEKALEKAGIKFAESQALVEKLEQDLAKIKLQYSLEVKELQRKVIKSVSERDQNVQIVQPFRQQKVSLQRDDMPRTSTELDATKQRLMHEAEMTKGFKVLLKDLHQLLTDIKDSGEILKKKSTLVERSTSTFEDNVPQGKSDPHSKHALDKRKDKKPESRQRKPSKVKVPLHSSSPKSQSPDIHDEKGDETASEFSVSDISDEENALDKQRRPVHFVDDQSNEVLKKATPDKERPRKSREKVSKLKHHRTHSSSDVQEDDVESLLISECLPQGSHERAQKILDLLTLKGQELTVGNQKIAELIGRQHDGIKRCREAEQNIKRILK